MKEFGLATGLLLASSFSTHAENLVFFRTIDVHAQKVLCQKVGNLPIQYNGMTTFIGGRSITIAEVWSCHDGKLAIKDARNWSEHYWSLF